MLLTNASAQDITPIPTETPTATPTFTETPTTTPTFIETLTLTPTSTVPETPSPTSLPTDTPTSAPEMTVEATTEATSEVTAEVTATVEALPTATATATTTPTAEPELTLLLSDNFDAGTANWTLGAGWSLIASEGGQALQAADGSQSTQLNQGSLHNVAAQARVLLTEGAVQLSVRDSGLGGYAALLRADGQVGLYRDGALLQSASTGLTIAGQWHTLRLSALSDTVRVSVDGTDTIVFTDTAPLSAGNITLQGFGVGKKGALVDDFMLWGKEVLSNQTPVVGELTFGSSSDEIPQASSNFFTLDETQYLTFIENFDNPTLEYWQAHGLTPIK